MKRLLFSVLFVVLAMTVIISEERIVNSKGQIIVLRDDGKWEIEKLTDNGNYTFRKTIWGMNKEQVKKSENVNFEYESDQIIVFNDTLNSLGTNILYIFVDNILVRSKYIISEKHTNKTEYISDYRNLKQLLTNKYGKPDDDEHNWKNDLYKDDPDEWGMAVAVGHLSFYCSWINGDTIVFLYMHGDNYEINFGIEYSSKKLSELEDTKIAEDIENKL